MRVVIDANIYLDFYRLPSNDLTEMQKLVQHLVDGNVVLYATGQIWAEVDRNRERVIAEALKVAKSKGAPSGLPQIIRHYDEWAELEEALGRYRGAHQALVAAAETDARDQNLQADHVIADLRTHATLLTTSEGALARAMRRVEVGNPPGKQGSAGDAITWETLLEGHVEGEDLHLVTQDQDFVSPLDPNRALEPLASEFEHRYAAKVVVYPNLRRLFANNEIGIELSEKPAIRDEVRSLIGSGSFKWTHQAIAALTSVGPFTTAEVHAMVLAADVNDQVSSILADEDVNEFYWNLLEKYRHLLDAATYDSLKAELTDPAIVEPW